MSAPERVKASDAWLYELPRAPQFAHVIRRRLNRIFVDDDYPKVFHRALQRILSKPGKLIRPMLTLFAAEATGRRYNKLALDAAIGIELVHVSSLILDDIVDRSPTRRGIATLHSKYGDDVAFMSAAVLLLRGLEDSQLRGGGRLWRHTQSARSLADMSRIRTLAYESARDLALGQAIEMRGKIASKSDYLRMIELKTATLFRAATAAGALAAGLSARTTERLSAYGTNLGMAFQIHDDLLDLTGSVRSLGKPAGADLHSRKATIVSIELCRALRTSRTRLASQELSALRELASERGVVDAVHELGQRYTRRAVAALRPLPDCPAKLSMLRLAESAALRRS